MPELCRFYGIIIRMYLEPRGLHNKPHFHAYYGEHSAVFVIEPLNLVSGFLPLRQKRLVEAWAELHLAELVKDWNLLQDGKLPNPIDPLN